MGVQACRRAGVVRACVWAWASVFVRNSSVGPAGEKDRRAGLRVEPERRTETDAEESSCGRGGPIIPGA